MKHIIGIALIGAGGIGKRHLESIAKLEAEGSARLVAVVEPAIENLPDLEAEFRAAGVRIFRDYRDLLENGPDCDLIVIAAPIHLHFEMTKACLQKGVFTLLEKPPVPLLQQLDELIELDQRRLVNVGFQHNCCPHVLQLKRRLNSGEIGRIVEMRVTAGWPRGNRYYERAGWAGRMSVGGLPVFDGPATNGLSHAIQMLMFLGETRQASYAEPVEMVGEFYRARPMESYDLACLRGRFANGTQFTAALGHACRKERPWKLEIMGEYGSLYLWERDLPGVPKDPMNVVISAFEQNFLHSYREFLAYMRGERDEPVTSLSDTRGLIVSTNAALLSSGGIHDISETHTRRYQFADGSDAGYEVLGIDELMDGVARSGLMFSELGAPWSAEARPVRATDLRAFSFDNLYRSCNEPRSAALVEAGA